MQIVKIELNNWRNFKSAIFNPSKGVTYLLGDNASGKSNFLDSLRFLRDIAKPIGGGLQTAFNERGGFSKVRCHHLYRVKGKGGTDLRIKVELQDDVDIWSYEISVNHPKGGSRDFAYVKKEVVKKNDVLILNRPEGSELEDPEQLKVTYLEQAANNIEFRVLANFFSGITYVHLVPQLLKYGERIASRLLPDDPFGQAFMNRIANTSQNIRDARLKKISDALSTVVNGLVSLSFIRDSEGKPHIKMGFKTFRATPSLHLEDQMSDGTLRLVALIWLLYEKHGSPLLLEEPELSLNEEIVRQLHAIFAKVTRTGKNQVFVTTHSAALLSNNGIPPESIFKITQREEGGSEIHPPNMAQFTAIRNGIPPSDVMLASSAKLDFDI